MASDDEEEQYFKLVGLDSSDKRCSAAKQSVALKVSVKLDSMNVIDEGEGDGLEVFMKYC